MGLREGAHLVSRAVGRDAIRADEAWALLRALAFDASRGLPTDDGDGLSLDERGALRRGRTDEVWIVARPRTARGWDACTRVSPEAAVLFDLYAPLCVGPRAVDVVLAHLGQSLDGCVSAAEAPSRFLTGDEDVEHTHRLRALFDAVVIGAQTAAIDDPRLTTRLVLGTQPVRVVLDPRARLDHGLRVFSDGACDTIVVTATGAGRRHAVLSRRVHVLELPLVDDRFPVPVLLEALRGCGLRRVFVEGGGVTVSHFLDAAGLDRLHLTIVPRRVGRGAAGVAFAPNTDLSELPGVLARRFVLGRDVLFDCDLRSNVH